MVDCLSEFRHQTAETLLKGGTRRKLDGGLRQSNRHYLSALIATFSPSALDLTTKQQQSIVKGSWMRVRCAACPTGPRFPGCHEEQAAIPQGGRQAI